MRVPVLTLFVIAALGAHAPALADDDPGSITATTAFMMGAVSVGEVHGFVAPGGNFDLGFRVRRWRLAAELGHGLWTTPAEADEPHRSGSFHRVGMALRWNWKELAMAGTARRPAVRFRGYAELGVGRQHVEGPGISTRRSDVMLGMGTAPEIRFRRVLVGATFGVRALISRAPEPDVLARGTCGTCAPTARHDLALLFLMGFSFGR